MISDLFPKRRNWDIRATILLVWGATVSIGLLNAGLTRAAFPGFVSTLLARPLAYSAALLALAGVSCYAFRLKAEQVWNEAVAVVPLAWIISLVASMSGLWNDGSGVAALPFLDALLFIGSAGILPRAEGPEGLLRAAVLVSSILVAWRLRENAGRYRAIAGAVLGWVAGALILLIPTWMAYAGSIYRAYPIAHSGDALRVLGMMQTDGYWSNFQADRFFAGVGRQLETGIFLSSTALFFLAAIILALRFVLRTQPWNRPGVLSTLGKRLASAPLFLFASPFAAGLVAEWGARRSNWQGINLVALALAVTVFLAWYIYWIFGRDLEDLSEDERTHPERPLPSGMVKPDDLRAVREFLAWLAAIGALILGWPILLVLLALLALDLAGSVRGLGWHRSKPMAVALWGGLFLTLNLYGAAFLSRGVMLAPGQFKIALVWGLTGLVLQLVRWSKVEEKRFGPAAVFLAFALLVLLVLQTYVILAISALALLSVIWLAKKSGKMHSYGFLLILIYGWVVSLVGS